MIAKYGPTNRYKSEQKMKGKDKMQEKINKLTNKTGNGYAYLLTEKKVSQRIGRSTNHSNSVPHVHRQ